MDVGLESILDRADELLHELEAEYDRCLRSKKVTERAKNMSHEVIEKLRNALDQALNMFWERHVAPRLSERQIEKARVYFPIANDLQSFHSILGRGFMQDLAQENEKLYSFLLVQQPFSSEGNEWLNLLAKIAARKHVRLLPQQSVETARITVSRPNGGSVSWNPNSVRFGKGVSIVGAPIDPKTQRIIPTSGVSEDVVTWVAFLFEEFGVNALAFCKQACKKTRLLIEDMTRLI